MLFGVSAGVAPEEWCSERARALLDGRAAEEVGDLYSKLRDDVMFRQEWAERVGLGLRNQ
jgi:hypothetical protein